MLLLFLPLLALFLFDVRCAEECVYKAITIILGFSMCSTADTQPCDAAAVQTTLVLVRHIGVTNVAKNSRLFPKRRTLGVCTPTARWHDVSFELHYLWS